MLVYVAHKFGGQSANIERAKKITRGLQVKDLSNCYICPIMALSCLSDKSVTDDAKTALRLDMLTVSDILLIASDIDEEMRQEIEFAKLVGMEVRYLENR